MPHFSDRERAAARCGGLGFTEAMVGQCRDRDTGGSTMHVAILSVLWLKVDTSLFGRRLPHNFFPSSVVSA
jgi:hypothetical protein